MERFVWKRLVLTLTSQHGKSNRKPNSVAPSAVKPKREISDSAMNYARRRALQSTCPTSTEQQQLYRALASVMTAVISSAPSHMEAFDVWDEEDSKSSNMYVVVGNHVVNPIYLIINIPYPVYCIDIRFLFWSHAAFYYLSLVLIDPLNCYPFIVEAHHSNRCRGSWQARSGFRLSTWQAATGRWRGRNRTGKGPPFTSPYGVYQFKVLPFGLCNAPAIFQRLMETALRGLVGSKCLVYLNDVIVFGKTAEGHTARLREVLRRPREVGLKVKPKKCRLIKRKVAYSGHIISEKGIATDPCKTCAVTPTCVTELRQFLGLASYYRKFVNGFVNIAAPLHRLLEKGAEWDWSKACQSAFDALKYHLTSAPILAYPEFHRRFTVDVDVRGDGLGAVLSQREGKTERVVAHADQGSTSVLRDSERNAQLGMGPARVPAIPLWPAIPAELDFEVEHRAGRLHGNADALSRASSTQCGRLVEGTAKPGYEDVIESIMELLVAVQQADSDIRLLRQWLVGANWPVECPMRDMHVLWRSGVVGRMKMVSSGDIAADSRLRKGLSRCWYREH
ncbi:Retrovirus-related Pol polyprotein from transposon 17.6 [Trichinella britovi]|uniref:RNA-directed DNA polymerase n=1 Tax=Trichinella britovi TaxID=45882 RepID=A0A0V1CKV3_TRIBR|nr:Retrovirus-related Pol polyprotein from transposon 17.6 [Trichinella britovi]